MFIEDGKDGLKELINFSEYIAISVPEIRKVHKSTYANDVVRLSHFIKSRKPEIDIHLLGCTEESILSRCSFCTSCDSSSWLRGTRYGQYEGRHVRTINEEAKQKRIEIIEKLIAQDGKIITKEYAKGYNAIASIVASLDKKRFEKCCGNQD